MTGFWNPNFWNGFGVVGLVLAMGFLMLVSLQRGWIIIGIHHREILAAKDYTITQLEQRSEKDAESINTLSQAIIEKNATETATTRILAELRSAATAAGEH